MKPLILFGILSLPLIVISWRTLFDVKSHGFYRFFSWECILWLFISNYRFWFVNPLGSEQIFSWFFLLFSVYLVLSGAILLTKAGKPVQDRNEKTLYQFEKTSELIDQGIFKYIRHPLYSSLLFLTWGISFKNITSFGLVVAMLSTAFLFFASIFNNSSFKK